MKEARGASKGLLVFTSAELPTNLSAAPTIQKLLRAVRQRYLLAVHYGADTHGVVIPPPWADLHFSAHPELHVRGAEPRSVLPFDESTFVPSYFRPGPSKRWDILSVLGAEPEAFGVVLRTLRVLKDERPTTRALLLWGDAEDSLPELRACRTRYEELFTFDDRQDITLLATVGEVTLARRDRAWLYAQCRCLLMGGSQPRHGIVTEVASCEVPVVLPNRLVDARLSFLTEHNSARYADEHQAAEQLRALLDRYVAAGPDASVLVRATCETHTIPQLLDALTEVYRELGLPWEGAVDTEELSLKLGSACSELLPDELRAGARDGVVSAQDLARWLSRLATSAGAPPPLTAGETLRTQVLSRSVSGQRLARRLLGRAQLRTERAVRRLRSERPQ